MQGEVKETSEMPQIPEKAETPEKVIGTAAGGQSRKKSRKKKKKASALSTIMTLMFLAIFLISAYKVVSIWMVYRTNAKNVENLQHIFYAGNIEHDSIQTDMLYGDDVEVEADGVNYTHKAFSIDPLIAINPDTVGWLTIPGANVDHVVVQGTNNSWYLYRSFYEEPNDCGTMFMDYRNTVRGELQNYIIYGHRMRDGSMFAHLDVYLSQEFYDENPSFTIYMEDGEYECQVFAAFRALTIDDYDIAYFETPEEKAAFIAKFAAKSEIVTNVDVTWEDEILTLSTCDRPFHKSLGRLVIMAKLVKVDTDE